MEFDADRHEARLAGSEVFASTARRLTELNFVYQAAQHDLHNFYRDGRLGDNLPGLMQAKLRSPPKELTAAVDEYLEKSTTGWFDTHPCDRERIASALRENAPGVFHYDAPATVLFENFTALGRNVTADFYREIFGPDFKPGDMHSIDELITRGEQEQGARESIGRYFQGTFNILRPFVLPSSYLQAPKDPRATLAKLTASRRRMVDMLASYRQVWTAYDEADSVLLEAAQAGALLDASLRPPSSTRVPMQDRDALWAARRQATARREQLAPGLADFERVAGERMQAAFELLHEPQVLARINQEDDWPAEPARLVSCLAIVGRQIELLAQLRNEQAALAALLAQVNGPTSNEDLIGAVQSAARELYGRVESLHSALRPAWYPFDHAKGEMTVAEYCLERMPLASELGEIYAAGGMLLDAVSELYVRIVGRLATIAEQVELAVGLPQLEAPPDQKANEKNRG